MVCRPPAVASICRDLSRPIMPGINSRKGLEGDKQSPFSDRLMGGENFGRDPVDWRDTVPPGLNQLVDLENLLFEDIELKYNMCQSQYARPFRSFVSPQSDLGSS